MLANHPPCISPPDSHGKGWVTFWGFLGHITKAVLGHHMVLVPQKKFLGGLDLRLCVETRRTEFTTDLKGFCDWNLSVKWTSWKMAPDLGSPASFADLINENLNFQLGCEKGICPSPYSRFKMFMDTENPRAPDIWQSAKSASSPWKKTKPKPLRLFGSSHLLHSRSKELSGLVHLAYPTENYKALHILILMHLTVSVQGTDFGGQVALAGQCPEGERQSQKKSRNEIQF